MQKSFKEKKPTLYLVSTPIGNLEDITLRAIEILKMVSVVFVEDTRVSKVLFDKYDIKTKTISYHEHDKFIKIEKVLSFLKDGLDIALISDAGTPGINDPGIELVREVVDNGFYAVSVPGASAYLTALVSSGLDIQPNLFLGFLPRKESDMKTFLLKYINVDASILIYESPFRVNDTIKVLYEVFGNRKVVLARELTKMFESINRGDLETFSKMEHINKGEYVIVIEGKKEASCDSSIEELYDKYNKLEIDDKTIIKLIANELNISKKIVYKRLKVEK